MNILFFNRSFYPDVESTGQLLTELCEDLTEYGHNVSVICGRSYYPGDKKFNFYLQFDKYKKVEVIRAWGTKFLKRFLFLRLLNLSTYFFLAFIAGFLVKNKPDVVIVQTDPPLLGPLGIFFSKWYKAKFVYSCQDLYPDVGIITGKLKSSFLNYLLKKINMISFKWSDCVISIGEDMKNRIIGKGIDKNKIFVIHNWADTNTLYPILPNENKFKTKYNLNNSFLVMYSGNIGFTQGLDKLVEVASRLKEKNNLRFLLVGDGADKPNLEAQVSKLELKNISFLPYQSKDELNNSLNSPDIHLITSQRGLAGIVVPSKIYGVLACGKPFIAWVDEESEINYIAKKYNCGIVVKPGNVEEMIKSLEWTLNNQSELKRMGENGRQAAVDFFDRKVSTGKFNKLIEEICL